MTEDEARKRWCPFARSRSMEYATADGDHAMVARIGPGEEHPSTFCIASGCMAWRWHRGVPAGGYCGLAGKPGA